MLGRVTFSLFGVYGASKYAVEALSDSLRHEVSQLNIGVALMQPGAYPTKVYSNATLQMIATVLPVLAHVLLTMLLLFKQARSPVSGLII